MILLSQTLPFSVHHLGKKEAFSDWNNVVLNLLHGLRLALQGLFVQSI